MKWIFEQYPEKTHRALEILLPLISWGLITMPFWLSFWHPALVAYFVIGFDVYWFYKSATLAINALRSYLTLSAHVKVDWLTQAKKIPGWNNIYHAIIIPEYKEPLSVLKETLDSLSQQDYPLDKIFVVLATEARDKEALETARKLKASFDRRFAGFLVTEHPVIKGEVAGKSSNMAWAGKILVKELQKKGLDLKNVTVTSCDSDILLHPKYFSSLTFHFLSDPDRFFHFYQPVIMFYSNIWRVPLPSRVLNTIYSITNLANLSQDSLRLINFSTYSLSLATVAEVGFWGIDIIPEDYHLFFKTYFAKGEKVRIKPIFLPALADAAESRGFFRTMVNQYEQNKRWAWGISDDPWILKNCFLHTEIPLWNRMLRLFNVLEQHLLWPTNWFILTLGSSLPPLINPFFGKTVLGHNLARISSTILTICLIFLVVLILLDLRLKPPRPKEFARWKIPTLFLQWVTLPIVSLFLSALPGLDAHTRLLLGKRLEYRVTEKV
ncbi:MAG: glycosyltransferase family 2 protein [Patescibacteria group bacterium]|nr:glycosyltransferase family 2 protein [Patescibacteria group bacterium]MCL5095239.1 glycosyltransferase family 2 protein [Patescibacteria group bacterium]